MFLITRVWTLFRLLISNIGWQSVMLVMKVSADNLLMSHITP